MRYFVLLFSILAFLATNSDAAIYYVGKSGSDANSCATAQSSTAGNRKLTIKAGINCMNRGDEVIIGNGTYDEWIHPDNGVVIDSGNSGAPTIIRCENYRACIVRPSGKTTGFLIDRKSWVTVKDIVFDGSMQSNTANFLLGISTNNRTSPSTNNIVLDGVEVKNAKKTNVLIQGTNITVKNCSLHNATTGSGLYWQAINSLMENCELYGNAHAGITGMDPVKREILNGNTVRYNVIRNNGTYGVVTRYTVFNGAGIHDNEIFGNSTASGGFDTINVGAGGNEIFNNKIHNNNGRCMTIADGRTTIIKNNTCYANNPNAIVDKVGGNVISNNAQE